MPCQPWLFLDLGLGSVPQEQACVASRGGWRAQGDGFVLCDDGGSQMGDEIDLQTEGRRVSVATLMQPERIPLFTAHLSGTFSAPWSKGVFGCLGSDPRPQQGSM